MEGIKETKIESETGYTCICMCGLHVLEIYVYLYSFHILPSSDRQCHNGEDC